jgi:pimeloyl-ACP methyl ester carboxylesterase
LRDSFPYGGTEDPKVGDGYDWRAQEARLNELDHFRTVVDGQRIHFVHVRSAGADAFPLLLTHGWPGSIVEFLDVIPRLRDDLHLVIPSPPGYGFSDPTRERGWDPTRIAHRGCADRRFVSYSLTRFGRGRWPESWTARSR